MTGERKANSSPQRGISPGRLTEREYALIGLVAEGKTNQEIAASVGTTENVVKNYLRIIYDKLGVWNRTELALWYLAHEADKSA